MSVPNPSRRIYHFSAGRNRSTFYWGGKTWDQAKVKYVQTPDLEYLLELDVARDKWKKHLLKGQHPPGVYDGACAVVGDYLYFYGGRDKEGKPTGSLFELNLSTKSWRELSRPGTGGPKKKHSCGMVAYNSTVIVYGGRADDGPTNELHMFDLKAGTWSYLCVTGDVPPPDWVFTFTKISNHQVVLRGGLDTYYILDLSRMHWRIHHLLQPGTLTRVVACLGLGTDHTQLLRLSEQLGRAQLLDVATWKWMDIKLPDDVVIPTDCSATAIQTSPTSVEVVMYGEGLVRLKFRKWAAVPEGVSPVQWWILTEYTAKGRKFEAGDVIGTELSKLTDPQTSSNTPENSKDNVDEVQAVSANKPDTIFTSSSDMQSEKTSKETNEVAAQSENIDATTVSDEAGFVSDVIEAVDQNRQIQRKMANIVLKGLPEAGKSTLLNRLLKRPFRKTSSSTGISDGIVVVDIQPTSTLTSATATSDNSSWEVIDFDASMYSQLEDSKKFLPSAEELSVKGNSGNDTLSYQIHGVSITSEVPDNIKKVLSAHNIKSIEDLQKKNSLYIRDTGGQVEFQESLTLLIYGPSIFIFVLRTDIDIYKKTIIQYRVPSGEIINRYRSSISTVDALIQFLTSVAAIDITAEGVFQEGGIYQSHKPVVFIVGTHIDQLKSRASSVIAQINTSLDKLIQQYNFSQVVRYANHNSSKVMYTVDNTSDKDDDFKVLRRDVNKFIGRHEFTVLYPVSYLLSCLELQNIKDTVISMDQFKQLVSKFNITSDQVNHLLQFLHFRIGIIQHYDVDKLSDIVIKEPQVLFNKVTDLLVKTFLTDEAMTEGEQTNFCQKGILEASSFENILEDSNDKITTKQFLAFMVHLRLAVPFTGKKGIQKYFIPSVLNHVPSSAGEERKTDIAPLCICFQLGHCPQGFFGVLISHLVNPKESHEFSFNLSEDKIYQDQVSLQVNSSEDVDEIFLKRHLSRIEITMYLEGCSGTESELFLASRSITSNTVCTTVRSILQDCLQLSLKTLHYDITKLQPMFCLPCPKSNCPVMMHEVTGKKCCFMYCKFSKMKFDIPSSGQYWFNGGVSNIVEGLESNLSQKASFISPDTTRYGDDSKSSTKLRKYISSIQEQYQKNLEEQIDKEIIHVVAKKLHNWDVKCDLLELDYNEVKDIKEENSSVSLQRIAALNHWKNRVGPDGTYRNLLRILALGDWHDSANKVITFLNSGSRCRRLACDISEQTDGRLYLTPDYRLWLIVPLAVILLALILYILGQHFLQ